MPLPCVMPCVMPCAALCDVVSETEFIIGDYPAIYSTELVGKIVEGLVSHIEGDFFWLQRDLDRVTALSLHPGDEVSTSETTPGTSVLGWWSDAWYRGAVVDNKEDKILVNFIDWGNTACLERDMVRICKDVVKKEQPLAVKCRLKDKVGLGDWEKKIKETNYKVTFKCKNLIDYVFVMEENDKMDGRIESVRLDLRCLQSFLTSRKEGIELNAQLLDDGRRKRSEKRKEILLKEMKIVLASLGEYDKKVMTDVKGEVYDCVRAVDKIGIVVQQSLEKLNKISDNDENQRGEGDMLLKKLKMLKEKVDLLDLDNLAFNLNMSVAVLPGSMAHAFDRINDAIFLKSPVINPKLFLLDFPDRQTNFQPVVFNEPSNLCGTNFDIKIHMTQTQTKGVVFSEFLLQRMHLMVGLSATDGNEPDCKRSRLEDVSLLSKMRKGQAEIMDPSRHGHCLLVHIKRPSNMIVSVSVRLLEANIVNSPLVAKFHGEVPANITTNDTIVGINMSDLNGLDESDLASLDLTTRRQMSTDPSSAFPRVSRPPVMSCLKESSAEGLLNNTTPFSPRSEGVVSTMKATAVNHQLVSALARLNYPDQSESRPIIPDQLEPVSMVGEDSIIAPSKTTSTVEEMQRSLSSDDSGSTSDHKNNTDASVLDKSVAFHPRTEICQFLPTPQVKETGTRFRLEEGQTKNTDGVSGLHKMLFAAQEGYAEEDTSLLDDDEDPHLMLNASKAPTTEASFGWGNLDDWNKNNEEETEGSFNPNRSLMPDVCQTESSLDQSVWEVDNQKETEKFNIRLRKLELSEVYNAQNWTRLSNRGFTAPCSTAYLPQVHKMLIAEPQYNRIGVYEATKMTFKAWLHCPGFGQGFIFNYPTSVLCLANGYVVILEKDKLHFLNPKIEANQPAVKGRFHGLAEDPVGGVWTLSEDVDKKIFARRFAMNSPKRYVKSQNIELKENQFFPKWFSQSKCRFLTVANLKIYITDMGLHKIYILDLNTGTQSTHGYFGSQDGQLHSPTGILVDEVGNLLVADNENDRLVIYSGDGAFVRTVKVNMDLKFKAPYGLMKQGDSVLVVYMGREEPGTVARLKIQQVCEEKERTDIVRPLE